MLALVTSDSVNFASVYPRPWTVQMNTHLWGWSQQEADAPQTGEPWQKMPRKLLQ